MNFVELISTIIWNHFTFESIRGLQGTEVMILLIDSVPMEVVGEVDIWLFDENAGVSLPPHLSTLVTEVGASSRLQLRHPAAGPPHVRHLDAPAGRRRISLGVEEPVAGHHQAGGGHGDDGDEGDGHQAAARGHPDTYGRPYQAQGGHTACPHADLHLSLAEALLQGAGVPPLALPVAHVLHEPRVALLPTGQALLVGEHHLDWRRQACHHLFHFFFYLGKNWMASYDPSIDLIISEHAEGLFPQGLSCSCQHLVRGKLIPERRGGECM